MSFWLTNGFESISQVMFNVCFSAARIILPSDWQTGGSNRQEIQCEIRFLTKKIHKWNRTLQKKGHSRTLRWYFHVDSFVFFVQRINIGKYLHFMSRYKSLLLTVPWALFARHIYCPCVCLEILCNTNDWFVIMIPRDDCKGLFCLYL